MDDFYIDKILKGDKDAFRFFIRKYKDMAFNLAISIVKDPIIAEELVQDSFLKAYNNLNSFKRKAKFSSWFYRIIVNESFGYLRKNRQYSPNEELVTIEEIAEEENFIENSDMDKVRQALLIMNPKESLVLNLYYLEEKKNKRNSKNNRLVNFQY